MSLTVSPIRTTAGKLVGAAAIARDITGRKLVEAENARLAAIVNSSDDAIFSTTREGIIATWNAGAQRMFGYAADEINGKHFSILVAEEFRFELAGNQERLLRGESLTQYEYENIRKDGSRIQVLLIVSPIKDAAGVFTSVSIVSRDITERKQAEAEQRRLVTAIEQSAEAVVITDPTGAIEYVNPAFTRITGYPREEVMGQNPRILKSEGRARRLRAALGDRPGGENVAGRTHQPAERAEASTPSR